MKTNKSAFTLIELVVAATILVILTSIGFYSYTQNISDARDSARKTDISSLASQLSLQKRERGAYPFPADNFGALNGSHPVAIMGKIKNGVALSTAENIPLDPELDIPYTYATTQNRQEYQLAASIENSESPYALVQGDYKSVAKNILPTLVLASNSSSDIDITSESDLFIFNNGFHTLPYDFESGTPYSDGSDLSTLINDAGDDFFQNSDFRSCEEIYKASKDITPAGSQNEYQIRNASGNITNITCACSGTGCTEV